MCLEVLEQTEGTERASLPAIVRCVRAQGKPSFHLLQTSLPKCFAWDGILEAYIPRALVFGN